MVEWPNDVEEAKQMTTDWMDERRVFVKSNHDCIARVASLFASIVTLLWLFLGGSTLALWTSIYLMVYHSLHALNHRSKYLDG